MLTKLLEAEGQVQGAGVQSAWCCAEMWCAPRTLWQTEPPLALAQSCSPACHGFELHQTRFWQVPPPNACAQGSLKTHLAVQLSCHQQMASSNGIMQYSSACLT